MMETLYTVPAWQLDVGDLIQFEAYDDEERYVELMRVESMDNRPDCVVVHGESMHEGDSVTHELDPFLEVEVMGA